MKIEKYNNALPEWLTTFVNAIKEKKTSQAEMQVDNLPTVNWNDNTFYVDVVNDNAILYNQYGNEVLNVSVHDLGKTEDQDVVSAVDKYLNEHYVVAASAKDGDTLVEKVVTAEQEDIEIDLDDCSGGTCDNDITFEQELQKVASLEDGLPDGETQEPTEDIPDTDEQEEITASVEEVEEKVTDEVAEEEVAEEPVEEVTEEIVEEIPVAIEETVSEEPALETDSVVSEGIENTVGEPSQGIEDEVGEVSEGIEDVATDTEVAPVCVDGVCEAPVEEVPVDGECCGVCDGECQEEDGFVTLASYNRLVAKVANLEKIVKAFTEAQHAYQEIPNDAYDLNCQEIEVQNFNESAELTQKVIDKEHELDLSNMNDRAKLNENFVRDIVKNDTVEQEIVLDEIKNGEETVTPEAVEEVPAETEVQTEEPATEEAPTEETVKEVPVEEMAPAEQEAVEETTDVTEQTEPELTTLTEEQIDEFAKQVCPFCHKGNLTPAEEVDGVIGVNCPECGKEFAVADEAIYTVK